MDDPALCHLCEAERPEDDLDEEGICSACHEVAEDLSALDLHYRSTT